MSVKYVLLKSPRGASLCVGVTLPENISAVAATSCFVRHDVTVEDFSFQRMMAFDSHYLNIYRVGAVVFEVASKVPFIPSDYFVDRFCKSFEISYKY